MFSFLKKSDDSSPFPWKTVNSLADLEALMNSEENFLLFKHSTRCIISKTVKSRFESMAEESQTDLYLIHVIEERPLSNFIAEKSGITHQSPQALLFQSGKCVYNNSHDAILDEVLIDLIKG